MAKIEINVANPKLAQVAQSLRDALEDVTDPDDVGAIKEGLIRLLQQYEFKGRVDRLKREAVQGQAPIDDIT